MAKLKHNPITNEMDLISESSFLDLIDDDAPVDSTVSSSFATLLSSAETEFNGKVVLFLLNMSAFTAAAVGTEVELAIQIDSGSDVVIGSMFLNTIGVHLSIAFTLIQTPSKGDHTINLRWRRKGGTGTVTVDANDRIQLKAISL